MFEVLVLLKPIIVVYLVYIFYVFYYADFEYMIINICLLISFAFLVIEKHEKWPKLQYVFFFGANKK